MNIRASILACIGTALTLAACAAKTESDPPPVNFNIAFPSTSAAVLTDSVKVYVFAGTPASCSELVRLRQTQQPLPPTVTETGALSPCQLAGGQGSTFQLPINETYTMLAVGQIGSADVFAGCVVQSNYGATEALPIPLSFIDNKQKLATTQCVKLSDKCSGACQ
ncbi:hypothetical protein AKJ09_09711 [Labilithrix luteola]|uniref:Lipoprotein n=1 Tax=Labilithrix luteola TaxID=1391654 RepID=A0A0K1QBD5_9BACT|nr:hypothetical protein [Labilithrix luteola]AKV03048.1 hypothetical protein AKJ09_09711 [Labilithrix luteola]